MALRELRLFDDRALHLPCRPVEAVDDRVRALLRDMAETVSYTPLEGWTGAGRAKNKERGQRSRANNEEGMHL